MKRQRRTALVIFVLMCIAAPFAMRPVTVIDVVGVSGRTVPVRGWTEVDGGTRVAIEETTTPIHLVLRGREFNAQFVTRAVGDAVQVRAVRKRAWIPVTQVAAERTASVSLSGSGSWLQVQTQ